MRTDVKQGHQSGGLQKEHKVARLANASEAVGKLQPNSSLHEEVFEKKEDDRMSADLLQKPHSPSKGVAFMQHSAAKHHKGKHKNRKAVNKLQQRFHSAKAALSREEQRLVREEEEEERRLREEETAAKSAKEDEEAAKEELKPELETEPRAPKAQSALLADGEVEAVSTDSNESQPGSEESFVEQTQGSSESNPESLYFSLGAFIVMGLYLLVWWLYVKADAADRKAEAVEAGQQVRTPAEQVRIATGHNPVYKPQPVKLEFPKPVPGSVPDIFLLPVLSNELLTPIRDLPLAIPLEPLRSAVLWSIDIPAISGRPLLVASMRIIGTQTRVEVGSVRNGALLGTMSGSMQISDGNGFSLGRLEPSRGIQGNRFFLMESGEEHREPRLVIDADPAGSSFAIAALAQGKLMATAERRIGNTGACMGSYLEVSVMDQPGLDVVLVVLCLLGIHTFAPGQSQRSVAGR